MVAVHDISCVGDASAYIWENDAEIAVQNVIATLAICHETILRHGSQLNYAAGKSECLIALRGPNATKIRKNSFVEHQALLDVAHASGTLTTHVVDANKHLGLARQ